jgi:hypothetical protein
MNLDKVSSRVHEAVVNYEPTWQAVCEAVDGYTDDELTLQEARDLLRDAAEKHYKALGLELSDLDDADFSAIIQYEIG